MVKKPVLQEVRVEDAVGMKLAHDLTKIVPGEFKGRVFAKGHVIREEDIPELLRIGKEHIYILDIPEGYLHEDEAARRMAAAVTGSGITCSGPVEGKITLKAEKKGLLKISADAIHALNEIDDVAISTVVSDQVLEAGQPIAGIRAIPLIIEEEKVRQVEELAAKWPEVIAVKPFAPFKVGVVTTGSEVYKGRIEDKFGPVLREKLANFGAAVLEQTFANDEKEMIQRQIVQLIEKGAELVLVTGGMSVDPDDRTPGAIKGISTEVIRYGTPVLPGSMMMIAYRGEVPIFGLPGCVIHDPFTAFDIFLPRVLAGEKIQKKDITRLGYGGYYTC